MQQKENQRVKLTKRLLKESLLSLMENEQIEIFLFVSCVLLQGSIGQLFISIMENHTMFWPTWNRI